MGNKRGREQTKNGNETIEMARLVKAQGRDEADKCQRKVASPCSR